MAAADRVKHRARFLAIGLALVALTALPGAVAAQPRLSIKVPANVSRGVVAAATVRFPRSVAAVDGRVLFATDAAELIGVAPLGAGHGLTPIAVDGGYAFGAYDLAPRKGKVSLRLVFLPKVSGKLQLRVLIDALADTGGRRLSVAGTTLIGATRVTHGSPKLKAPAGVPRGAPSRAAQSVRSASGRPSVSIDDVDVVRAGWYETRARSTACVAGQAADANGDGCVDIVDLQATLAAQPARSTSGTDGPSTLPSGSPSSTLTAAATPARTFTVTSTADTPDAAPGNGVCANSSGQCTLRAALTESNWQSGLTRIAFNLPGTAPVTIQLGSSSLPNVGTSSASVFIDGYSQPGSRPNDALHGTNAIPGVEVRGAGMPTSQWIFYVPQGGNTMRGLLLDNAQRGIFLDGAASTNNVVIGNWIGFAKDNSLPPRGTEGVLINNGAHNNVIGTADPADRNVIGNWDTAVNSNGPGTNANVVQNNDLCMRPNGAGAICQTGVDFNFGPKNNLVGGFGSNEGNVIGPTCCNGVELSHGWDPSGSGSGGTTWQISGQQIIGNWIGFRADGSYDPTFRSALNVPTYDNGQAVNVYDGSVDNLVQANYIAAAYDGVTIASLNSTGNVVRDNIIGRSPLGEPAPLAGWGIYLRWDTHVHSIIGNQISNAATGGIGLIEFNVTNITISRNTVDSTSGPAIYFAPDPNNASTGANNLLAGPSISATTTLASGTALPGATVEVFQASRAVGATGLPIAFLGEVGANATTGAWSLPIALADGDRVTALQTRTNGTSSMLSANVPAGDVGSPPVADFSWSQLADTLTVEFTDASSNGPTAWQWDFGDGATSTAQNPSHSYAAPGDYTVILIATNAAGPSTASKTVHLDALPAGAPFAADSFARIVSSGWGNADTGGPYTLLDNQANYGVSDGVGLITLPKAGNTRSAVLEGVVAADVDMTVKIAVNKAPTGGAQYVYAIARSIGNNSYRPKVILYANGSAAVHAGVMLNNNESSLGPAVAVPGLTPAAGQFIWLRAQVSGTNPTSIKVKAWRDGEAEPSDWQFSATNSASVLQAPGGVGMSAYLGTNTSNAPVTFSFDDVRAVDPNAGAGTPPTAFFTFAQQAGTLKIDFTDHSSGTPTDWSWDFGDGSSSTQRSPSHSYASSGPYQVTLTVSNALGQSSTTQTVDVAEPPPPSTYAQDAFSRTVSDGWGSADIGGVYAASGGSAALNVGNGVGTIMPPRAGATRGVVLDSVSVRDLDIAVKIAAAARPSGGTIWVYEAARHSGNNEYRPKILLQPNGSVAVHAGRVVSDAESPIGQPVTVPGLTYSAGQFIWLRAEVTGANPTTIKIKAWADGSTEPSGWQYSATDSTTILQSAGSVGLRSYVSTSVTNAPIAITFDDYLVNDPGAAAPPPSAGTAVLVGAGDIGYCGGHQAETAATVAAVSGTVFTAGDNAYPDGSATDFADCYDPSWGAFKSRTAPTPGNHDFQTAGASGYFGYYGALAGPSGVGYYAYDAEAWRIYALNSECSANASCTAQLNWLTADLAANPHQCSLAIWHRPRFSGGPHGDSPDLGSLFEALHGAGVELLVSGHDHVYERLTPADPTGAVDTAQGIRQFVVGTGGAPLYQLDASYGLLEAGNDQTYGVLRLDLAPGSYSWQFLPAGSGTFTDSGSTSCH